MECVVECDATTQVMINDTQFDNRPICRDLEYYVNPDSNSIIELGTRDHPYKQITYAFIEILNYHSHSDRNLTIYLMENTRNGLPISKASIINITNVDIKSYTNQEYTEPDKATIIGMDDAEILASPSTSFSIMKSYELRFDDMVTNSSYITDEERIRIATQTSIILLFKSSISLENLEILSDHADIFQNIIFLYPVYLQHRKVTYKDVDIAVSGTIQLAYDPLNIDLENINIDQYKSIGGFDMDMQCNYPEAEIDAHLYAKNINIFYSQDRLVFPTLGAALESQLPGDMVVENYISTTYLTPEEFSGVLNCFVQPT